MYSLARRKEHATAKRKESGSERDWAGRRAGHFTTARTLFVRRYRTAQRSRLGPLGRARTPGAFPEQDWTQRARKGEKGG